MGPATAGHHKDADMPAGMLRGHQAPPQTTLLARQGQAYSLGTPRGRGEQPDNCLTNPYDITAP